MQITTDHPSSGYGMPVFLDDNDNVIDYSTGIKAIRKNLGLNTKDFGNKIGVSPRTIEDWEQGRRMPQKPAILLMSSII